MNPLRVFRALLLTAISSLASSAHGQDRLLAPLNAAAPVPSLAYQSLLADYRPNQDSQPADWRTVNDMVGRGSGHAGHSMGPAKPATPSAGGHAGHSMEPAKPATPSAGGHAGHSMGPAKPATPPAATPAEPPKSRTHEATHQHKHKE